MLLARVYSGVGWQSHTGLYGHIPALRLWNIQESEQKVDKHFVTRHLRLGKALVISVDMCSYCHWLYLDLNQLFTAAEVQKLKVAVTCVHQLLLFDLGFLHVLLPIKFHPGTGPGVPGVATPLHVWFEVVCQASGFDVLIDKIQPWAGTMQACYQHRASPWGSMVSSQAMNGNWSFEHIQCIPSQLLGFWKYPLSMSVTRFCA